MEESKSSPRSVRATFWVTLGIKLTKNQSKIIPLSKCAPFNLGWKKSWIFCSSWSLRKKLLNVFFFSKREKNNSRITWPLLQTKLQKLIASAVGLTHIESDRPTRLPEKKINDVCFKTFFVFTFFSSLVFGTKKVSSFEEEDRVLSSFGSNHFEKVDFQMSSNPHDGAPSGAFALLLGLLRSSGAFLAPSGAFSSFWGFWAPSGAF